MGSFRSVHPRSIHCSSKMLNARISYIAIMPDYKHSLSLGEHNVPSQIIWNGTMCNARLQIKSTNEIERCKLIPFEQQNCTALKIISNMFLLLITVFSARWIIAYEQSVRNLLHWIASTLAYDLWIKKDNLIWPLIVWYCE